MKKRSEYLFIGIDVHKDTHTAVIMTFLEEQLGFIEFTNTIKGFQRLTAYVTKCIKAYQKKNQGQVLEPIYGLEDVSHYGRNLAIYLLDHNHMVKEVNSALSYMERMSYPTVKKSDTWDAQCVCAVFIRRYECLPKADPKDYYWIMKQLVHRRKALVQTKTKLIQQFHEQIPYDYPSYRQFFHEVDCQTSLAFFENYPSSGALVSVETEELAEFLRNASRNSLSTKRAERILGLVDADGIKPHDYQFGRDFIIQSMMRNLRFIQEELKRIETLQKRLLGELNYQLETIPGVNTVTACALVGLIGDIRRFKSASKLANYAGVAPLCFSSGGKGKSVQNKNQGNRELYAVFYLLAMQQIQINTKKEPRNPVLRAYYERKVSEGKTKIQALICLMRRLVNIIYSMMKHETAYRMPEVISTDNKASEKGRLSS